MILALPLHQDFQYLLKLRWISCSLVNFSLLWVNSRMHPQVLVSEDMHQPHTLPLFSIPMLLQNMMHRYEPVGDQSRAMYRVQSGRMNTPLLQPADAAVAASLVRF